MLFASAVRDIIGPFVASCGSPCACQTPPAARPAGTLYAVTVNRHTRTVLRRCLNDAGTPHRLEGELLRIEPADSGATLLGLRDALSATEAEEVRVFFCGGRFPTLAEAVAVQPLRAAAAAVAHAPVLALFGDESAFFSRYQPIVDARTGETVAFEALLRAHDGMDEVQPAALFGAAEAAGKIHVLDRIGRETALRGAQGWLGDRSIFVNFIPTSIYRPEVCLQTTMAAAEGAGIAPSQIVFEVVESHSVGDTAHLLSILDYYRSGGCRVALDDVGAGYSSLNLMAAIRPDVVKIDRDLVQALPDPAAVAVVRAIVRLSHELGATVIAECVETQLQADVARDLGADWAQGWLFGRPEPAAVFRASPRRVSAGVSS